MSCGCGEKVRVEVREEEQRAQSVTWLFDQPVIGASTLLWAPLQSHTFHLVLSMEELQARLQAGSTEYQKLQSDLSVAVDSRQRLDAQFQENEMVKKVG